MKFRGQLKTSAGTATVSEIREEGGAFVMFCTGPIALDDPEFRLEISGHAVRFSGTFRYEDGRLTGEAKDVEILA